MGAVFSAAILISLYPMWFIFRLYVKMTCPIGLNLSPWLKIIKLVK